MDYGCLGSLITVALKYCKYLIEKSDQILGEMGKHWSVYSVWGRVILDSDR